MGKIQGIGEGRWDFMLWRGFGLMKIQKIRNEGGLNVKSKFSKLTS